MDQVLFQPALLCQPIRNVHAVLHAKISRVMRVHNVQATEARRCLAAPKNPHS